MSEVKIEALQDDISFGARVTGVTWDNIHKPDVRAQIASVFEDRGLVLFAGMESTSEMQVELAGILGPLRHHAMQNVPRADADAGVAGSLMELHNDPADHSLFEVDGVVLAGCTPWHYDACYAPQIYRGGVLRALEISPTGGETGFADGIQLYQDISPESRAEFERLEIVYDPGLMHNRQKFGLPKEYRILGTQTAMQAILKSYENAPRSIHPAIWQRASGEKVLHVSPWQAAGIFGRENPEGDALLESLCQEMIAKMRTYWHKWKPDHILAWDNWRMLHAVSGHDPEQSRKVHRATIEGDYGLGRAEKAQDVQTA